MTRPPCKEALPGPTLVMHRGRVASVWEGHTVFANPPRVVLSKSAIRLAPSHSADEQSRSEHGPPSLLGAGGPQACRYRSRRAPQGRFPRLAATACGRVPRPLRKEANRGRRPPESPKTGEATPPLHCRNVPPFALRRQGA